MANKNADPAISARIDRLMERGKVKAIASVNIGGVFALHGVKIIDSEKGLFVSMPWNKFEKDGKIQYTDIFHPVTADARNALSRAVLAAYNKALQMQETESQEIRDAPTFTQSM